MAWVMRKGIAAVPALASIAAVAMLAGCPGTLDDQEKFLAPRCTDVPTMFAQRCTVASGCHTAADMAGQLDLESPDLASRVVGVASTAACAGRVLADPADPEGSVIYFKLEPAPSCGSKMPLIGTPLSDFEIECVRLWIMGLTPGTPTGAGGAGGGTGGQGGTSGGGGAGGV